MEKLKVRWSGYGGGSPLVEELRPIIQGMDMEITTIHEWANADIKWELNTWLGHLKEADIIILPIDYKKFPAKSANKLTQALSLGKPVICSPLPAYVEVEKKYPECCLFADSKEEWEEQLLRLRNSSDLRKEIGLKGLEASKDYSVERMGQKWLQVINNVKVKSPTVDLIIVNYNNLRYLKLCVDSILKNTFYPFNLIISDAGSNDETWDYLKGLKNVTVVGSKGIRKNYSEASNDGIRASHSEYFAILNSDLIVSENWLNNIMNKFNSVPGLAACGVLSNCDKGWLF